MQVVLVTFKADGGRRSFSLPRDVTVIGRKEDCDVRIPLGEVSRKHCRLVTEGESLRLEDMGSSNGTYLNGQRVQEVIVQAGDALQVGSVVFVVQIDGIPSDEEIQPAAPADASGDTRKGGASPGTEAPVGEEFVIAHEEAAGAPEIDELIDLDMEPSQDDQPQEGKGSRG